MPASHPQPPSPTAFGNAQRARQAQYREHSATVSAAGRAPDDEKGKRHGHLLALGYEEENLIPQIRGPGGAIDFFAQRGIKWHQTARSGDRGAQGPTRNMCSSQVACVNTLFPLREQGARLTALVKDLNQDVRDVIPLTYESAGSGTVSSLVEFEWTGIQGTLEGSGSRGANATSADALIVAETIGGTRRAYLFEWKYTEEYRTAHYLGDGKSGATRRLRYERHYLSESGCIDSSIPFDELLYEPFYQIARLGLLGDRMVEEREFGVEEARVVVVCPDDNKSYRETIPSPALARRFPTAKTVDEVARSVWRHTDGVRVVCPKTITRAARSEGVSPGLESWSSYMKERYDW